MYIPLYIVFLLCACVYIYDFGSDESARIMGIKGFVKQKLQKHYNAEAEPLVLRLPSESYKEKIK